MSVLLVPPSPAEIAAVYGEIGAGLFDGAYNPTINGWANRYGAHNPTQRPGLFDDWIVVTMIDPDGLVEEFLGDYDGAILEREGDRLFAYVEATTDPGAEPMANPSSAAGVARVEAMSPDDPDTGWYPGCWSLGYHRESSAGRDMPALRQVGAMDYRRHVERDDTFAPGERRSDVRGFNFHTRNSTRRSVWYHSEGCQVASSKPRHRGLMVVLWATAGDSPSRKFVGSRDEVGALARLRVGMGKALAHRRGRGYGSRFSYRLLDRVYLDRIRGQSAGC